MNIKKVKIGPFDFTVVKDHVFEGPEAYYGTANYSTSKIHICGGLEKKIEAEVMVHEVLHCVDHVFNGAESSESTIRALSLGLTTAIRDNKTFFKKLLDIL